MGTMGSDTLARNAAVDALTYANGEPCDEAVKRFARLCADWLIAPADLRRDFVVAGPGAVSVKCGGPVETTFNQYVKVYLDATIAELHLPDPDGWHVTDCLFGTLGELLVESMLELHRGVGPGVEDTARILRLGATRYASPGAAARAAAKHAIQECAHFANDGARAPT